MLEKIDLLRKMEKKEFKSVIKGLEIRIGELQREARNAGIPIVIIFEGWDTSGKGSLINNLILTLDPRGYDVHAVSAPNEEESARPFLWRFWTKTPEKGRISIFDRSWYGKVLVERVEKITKKRDWKNAYTEINSFEQQLTEDGTVIIKFFLHISKKEQIRRLKKIKENYSGNWKLNKEDIRQHKHYSKYLVAIEEMLEKTDTENAPWIIIESFDFRFATVKVFNTLITAVEREINNRKNFQSAKAQKTKIEISNEKIQPRILERIDLKKTIIEEEYENQLSKVQKRLSELEREVYLKKIPVIILYEGWDASGKGGNIRQLITGMDPRSFTVVPVSAPNDIEKRHHYLWRFWQCFPKSGHITIFDRSWYGRVLVERVEGFCSEEEWKRSYREINEMEEQFINFGAVMVKFWLHIDKDEQLKRFQKRENVPYKKWKITPEDYRNREKWNEYEAAVNEMLIRTSTSYAPWTVVEANSKHFARLKTISTVSEAIEKRL